MMKRTLLASACAAVLGMFAGPVSAADAPIYGSRMMTPQERDAYRDRMRAARTVEERDRIRNEHHAQMVARAKERGITLPEEPPMSGGMGPGGGMGAGGGMGPGGMGPGGTGRGGRGQ